MLGFGFFANMAIGATKAIYTATKDDTKGKSNEQKTVELAGKAGAGLLKGVAAAADAGLKMWSSW